MVTRIYNCKDEELPVIGSYLAFSLKRDLADFTAFSPKFDNDYAAEIEMKLNTCLELVSPKEETSELKIITKRLYSTIGSLTENANALSVYIKMAKTEIPISVKDFGISLLRDKARRKDAEGVIQALHVVTGNIRKYREPLMKQGATDGFIDRFTAAGKSIFEDNRKQYEISGNRKELVQSNVALFNELYNRISEICEVGKALYKGKDAKKLQEYTFTELIKRVRIVSKSKKNDRKNDLNAEI
jgi:hypothetical protein